jgi:predicted transcriptional regulator YdeE
MYDLSIEKTLELHAYMSNVVDNTNIARISGSMEMLTVLKSKNLVFNIENKFLDNFSRIFHRILENFFSEDNFEFDDDKITNMGF